MSEADRIVALEMLAAEQERTIAELSAQMAEQWTLIERLQKTVDELARRLLTVEDQAAPTPPATKPPHW